MFPSPGTPLPPSDFSSARQPNRLQPLPFLFILCFFGMMALLLPPRAAAQSYSQTLPWNYSTGNSTLFSAYLNGQVTLSGDSTGTAVAAQSAAGGSVLGHSKEIVSVSASLSASLGVPSGTITVKEFGSTKYTKSLNSSLTADIYSKSYDSCDIRNGPDPPLCAVQVFPVGPFAVVVQAGVVGNIKLDYSIGLNKGAAFASLTPAVSGAVYVKAQVDFFVADVGVGANLTLINDSFPMGVTATLAPNYFTSPPAWGVKWGFNIANKLNLLNGNIFLYADIRFLFFKESWKTTIFSWPGITTNSTLFNDTGWVPIGVPLPYLSSLSPPSVIAGSGNTQLTINGSGFDTVDPFSVQLDGSPVAYQNLTPTQAVFTIPSTSLASPGIHHITVANGGLLGGTSNPLPFHVILGAPVLTQVSPGAVTAGGASFTLAASGASLISGSTVWWNSTPLTTTYVSDSQLTALVPAANISSVGSALISVHYPGTNTAISNVVTLPIFDPNQPIVTQTFPSNAFPGSSNLTIHVVGTGFVTGSVVYWNGSSLATTYVSGVQLDALVPASLLAAQTIAQVDVLNPSGSPSNAVAFTVAPVTYTAVEMPLPPGQTANATPSAVNSNGLVAINANDDSYAYVWSESGGIVPIPIAAPPGSTLYVFIQDMNNLGQVVGYFDLVSAQASSTNAFLFSNGTVTSPPLFVATGINDNGQIVGYVTGGYPSGPITLPAISQGGVVQIIDTLGSLGGGNAVKVSNTGQVVGDLDPNPPSNAPPVCPRTAFSWISSHTTQLPLLSGTCASSAVDVNDFGAVIGYGVDQKSNSYPWLWEDGTIQQLPTNSFGPLPIGINNSGDVLLFLNPNYYLYSGGNLYELNSLLSNPTVGYLYSASAISDNGFIAGTLSKQDGTFRPVLLKPNSVPSNSTTTSAPALTSQAASESIVAAASGEVTKATKDLPSKPRGFWNGSFVVTTPVMGVTPSSVVVGTNNFQITVNGSNFVSGAIVYWNGLPLNTTLTSSSSLVAAVPVALLASAGYATITAINPGGSPSNGFVIAIVNPTPAVTMLSAQQATAGAPSFTMTISGIGFLLSSQVYWNDLLLAATYVSSTQIAVVIPAAQLAVPSVAAITVVNPSPGGGASAPAVFGVNPPAPVASSISPSSSLIGATGVTLTVSGSGFDLTSVVSWNDTALQTTYISPSALSVQIPDSYLATAGTAAITVIDTIPGGWPSQSLLFTIGNPTPQLNNVSPASLQAGGASSTITLTGAGFVTGSQVYIDGGPLATTYVSGSQLTASLSNNAVAIAKTAQLTVVNPQPCDTPTSTPLAFTITAPPVIQSISPATARTGSAALTIQVTGSGFTSQSTVTWNGTSLATTSVSATQLNATIPASSIASAGTFPIRVMQQVPGGGSSAAAAFTVYDTTLPQPAISGLTPPAVMAGSNNFVLVINGTSIVSTTSALWNGAALPSAYISSNSILVPVPAANVASSGKVTIQLQTPADNTGSGGGVSNSVVFTVYDGTKAATTDYTSAAAFTAATSNITTVGFNGILPNGQNFEGFSPLSLYGITFSTPNPSTDVNITASAFYAPINYPSDFIVNSANPSTDNTLVIALPSPTHAIGLNYGGLFGSGANTITLSNGHVFTQPATPAAGTTQFVGFVSVDPITSLTLTTSSNSWVVLNLLIGSPLPPVTTLTSSLNPSIAGQAVTFTSTVTTVSGGIVPTGSVIFLDSGIPIGTANLDSTGTAAFQTGGLSVAQHSIAAQYVGDDNYSSGSIPPSPSLTQTVNAAPTPDFTFLASVPSVTIPSPGASSTPVTLTITAQNGYTGTVAFTPASCSISPAGSLSTCNFSAAAVTGSGSTQVTINTTAASASFPFRFHRPDGFNLWAGRCAALLALVFLFAIRKQKLRWTTAVSIVAFMFLALGFTGCGGAGGSNTGGGNPGTPTGVTYTVTITATANGGQPSHTASFTFSVQ
jgi:probable HAF family extracellular repeat protein